MGTKSTPGKFDCYQNAEPDEPMFVLLGRDRHAPTLVWLWAVLRELDQEDPEKVKEARECCLNMMVWAKNHGRKSVGIGQAALAGVLELIRCANYAVKEASNCPTDMEEVRKMLCNTTFEFGDKLPS